MDFGLVGLRPKISVAFSSQATLIFILHKNENTARQKFKSEKVKKRKGFDERGKSKLNFKDAQQAKMLVTISKYA